MNEWILVLVILNSQGGLEANQVGEPIMTMTHCFEKRDAVIKHMGRPIVGYQAVCISRLTGAIK